MTSAVIQMFYTRLYPRSVATTDSALARQTVEMLDVVVFVGTTIRDRAKVLFTNKCLHFVVVFFILSPQSCTEAGH